MCVIVQKQTEMSPFFLCDKYFSFQVYLILVITLFTVLRNVHVEAIKYIAHEDMEKNLVPSNTNTSQNLCTFSFSTESDIQGYVNPHYNYPIFPEDPQTFAKKLNVKPGGEWEPSDCKARYSVALIIPYRDRLTQLSFFIRYIHIFLYYQQIQYRIYVIEQTQHYFFNRGLILNAGYLEAKKDKNYSCFIFHDVDIIPSHRNNYYACSQAPRHMSVLRTSTYYRLPYPTYFDGAVSFLPEHFEKINGFSNKFYGSGGEDEDLYNRVVHHGLEPIRFPNSASTYSSLAHVDSIINKDKDAILQAGKNFYHLGLNSTKYDRHYLSNNNEPLFTRIMIRPLEGIPEVVGISDCEKNQKK
ncbi:hypothetical protein V9T40_001180 [Parthenolecanium corni]|uniref:Beta-1,4-N-acetylgalactosaminyltransferase n=1 Tax=Parthenolecanium corni TaxID=536013 RepID=A0AAN9TCE5_9HEMI